MLNLDPRCAEIVRELKLYELGSDGDVTYWASREIP